MKHIIGESGMPILVEDSPGDVRLTEDAFREANGSARPRGGGEQLLEGRSQ